ncbi:MAG: hypothetical protein KDI11_09915, partial [Alphaproteobacteria bacterium]|nr:hypothetical protein [Alphaproteobacteria bacterium]
RKKWQQPPWINQSAWNEFETHRKEIREPLSNMARTKAANLLKNLTHEQQQECIDKTIQNRWKGLFPERKNNGNKYQSHKRPLTQSEINQITVDEIFGRHAKPDDERDVRPALGWNTEDA